MTRAPRTIATTALASEALGGDERAARSPRSSPPTRTLRGGPWASCTCTTACAPASSEPMANGPGLHSRIVAILKVGPAAGCARPPVGAVPGADRRPDRRGGLLAGRRRGAREAGCRSPTRPSPARPAVRTASASPPTLVVPDAAPPQRAAITTLAGTIDLHNGPSVTVQADTGDLDIPTQRLDLSGKVAIRPPTATGSTPTRRRSICAPGPSSPETRCVSTRAARADHLRQPARRPGSRRAARRVASLSETACGCYTIRRTRSKERRDARGLVVGRCWSRCCPGSAWRRGRPCRSAG